MPGAVCESAGGSLFSMSLIVGLAEGKEDACDCHAGGEEIRRALWVHAAHLPQEGLAGLS